MLRKGLSDKEKDEDSGQQRDRMDTALFLIFDEKRKCIDYHIGRTIIMAIAGRNDRGDESFRWGTERTAAWLSTILFTGVASAVSKTIELNLINEYMIFSASVVSALS